MRFGGQNYLLGCLDVVCSNAKKLVSSPSNINKLSVLLRYFRCDSWL